MREKLKIYLEHKGKEIVSQKTLKGKSIIKTSFSNSSDTVKADNLFKLESIVRI